MALPEFPLSVSNHAGQPNDPGDVFFGELEALGPVQSAKTNLNSARGRRNWTGARIGAALVGVLLGAVVGMVIFSVVKDANRSAGEEWLALLGGGGALLGFVLFAWLGRPWDVCTLVAKLGLAKVRRRGERVRQQILVFEQAAQLRQQQVRMYYNGVYVGTRYQFDWLDGHGKRLFRIAGSYRERKRKPVPPTDLFFFAQAAENAWGEHRLPAIEAAIARHVPVRFPVGKDGYIEVGADYLEIKKGRAPRRLAVAEIEKIDIVRGQLVVKPRGGGWFSSLGLQTARIGDLKILLGLLQKSALLQAGA